MNIYSQDIGPEMEQAIVKKRAEWNQRVTPSPHPNLLMTFFVASVLGSVCSGLAQMAIPAVFFGVVAMTFAGWYLYLAKEWSQSAFNFLGFKSTVDNDQRPLTVYEVQDQNHLRQNTLMRSYLDLVINVIAAPAADAEAEREVRSALKALSVAVLALPIEDKIVSDHPQVLREEAAQLAASAEEEPDAVIGSSLRRRAESLVRRADTTERTILLLRRNQALREETAEQIDALRTSLTAFQVGGKQLVPEISTLAASIQRVALEANAITSARAEIDTALSEPWIKANGQAREKAAMPIFIGNQENTAN